MGLNKYCTPQPLIQILDVHPLSETITNFVPKASFLHLPVAACVAAPQSRGRRASGLRWMQPYSRTWADAYRRAILTLASGQWCALDTTIVLVNLSYHSLASKMLRHAFCTPQA